MDGGGKGSFFLSCQLHLAGPYRIKEATHLDWPLLLVSALLFPSSPGNEFHELSLPIPTFCWANLKLGSRVVFLHIVDSTLITKLLKWVNTSKCAPEPWAVTDMWEQSCSMLAAPWYESLTSHSGGLQLGGVACSWKAASLVFFVCFFHCLSYVTPACPSASGLLKLTGNLASLESRIEC